MSDGGYLWGVTYVLALVAALLALPITLLLLRLYRRSILRLMNLRGRGESGPSANPLTTVVTRDGSVEASEGTSAIKAVVRRNMVVVVAVSLLFGAAYALLLLLRNDIDVSVYRLGYFMILYAWPGVIGVWVVTAGRRMWVCGSLAIYLAALLAIGLIGGGGVVETLIPWLWALLPTAAVVAFLARPFRGVGPIVLGTMMVGIVGSQVFASTVIGSEGLLDLWIDLFFAAGVTDAVVMFWGLDLVGFLLACAVAVAVARLLAGWYSRGGFSDHMLLLGSVFLVFAMDQSLAASPTDAVTFGLGLGIYAVMGGLSFLAYRLAHSTTARPTSLLLLRVFSPNGVRQPLLDRVTARWRHLGPVRLIAAPDLAVATVEPDEFLVFVFGKLRRLFIDTTEALERRRRSLRLRPDPDGRFRVDEFFCFDNTWRPSVATLLGHTDAVLMDLRGFGPGNDGCIAEIRMLASGHAMPRTVLLVDSSTDRSLLDAELSHLPPDEKPSLIQITDDAAPDPVVRACLEAAARPAPLADASPG